MTDVEWRKRNLTFRPLKGVKCHAVKIYKETKLEREPIPGYWEISVLKKLKHPNIVQYISNGIFIENSLYNSPYLIMEYVSHGSLDEKLENLPKNGSLPKEFVVKLAVDISNALVHLHFDHLLVHRDIKPPNILLQAATESRSNFTR